MAQRSELIEVELPDNSGKTTTFYTYDGYLEDNERRIIRQERRNFEQLKVTGAAIFGFVSYFVPPSIFRLPADSRSPSSASEDAQFQSEAFSRESSEALLTGTSLLSSDQAGWLVFNAISSSAHRPCPSGRT